MRVLQNPGFPAFSWGPCPWTSDPNCEKAVWVEPVAEIWDDGTWHGAFYQSNLESRVAGGNLAVVTDYPPRIFLIDQAGTVLAGVDYPGGNGCAVSTGRPKGDGLLFNAGSTKAAPFFHPCLLQAGTVACTTFTPSCDVPIWNDATDTHWGWECTFAMYAMSSKDGSMQQLLSQQSSKGPVYDVDNIMASKKHLFWTEHVDFEGHVARRVSYSNGIDPPKVLLPPGPGTQDDGDVHFTGSALVWTRGYDFVDLAVYKKVELWMSPWDDDAPRVTPIKVMDWTAPTNSMTGYSSILWNAAHAGGPDPGGTGPGRFAHPTGEAQLEVLDLATATPKASLSIPPTEKVRKLLGLTSTHLWFLTYDYPGQVHLRNMYRWRVAP